MILAAVLAWVGASAAAPTNPEAALLAEVERLLPLVEDLRGLPFERAVEVFLEDPEQVRAHVLQDAARPEALESLEDLRLSLVAFHQLDRRADLAALVADVLTAQLGGYYDPDELRLVLVRRDDIFQGPTIEEGSEEAVVTAHELVHALQDQHFDLWTLHNRTFLSSDVEAATTALVEGDASYAMLRLTLGERVLGLDSLDATTFHAAFVRGQLEGPWSPTLARLPAPVREGLFAPYVLGTAFVRMLERTGGWALVDEAFTRLPLSTEHVLHPTRWLADTDPPLYPELPDVSRRLGLGYRLEVDDVVGELGVRSLLATRGVGSVSDERFPAAEGWGGDRYHVYRDGTGHTAVVWRTLWDSEQDAEEFAEAAVRLAVPERRHRFPILARARQRAGTWTLDRRGNEVTVLVDVPAVVVPAVLAALRGQPATPILSLDQVSSPRGDARASDAGLPPR